MSILIPGYERLSEIGTGGFSRVYEAHQVDFNRPVAIKVLNLEGGHSFDRQAFEDECQAMGMVSEHPYIVTVYAGGFTSEGAPYIAMERYRETLLDRIKASRSLSPDVVLDLGVKMAAALHRAHGARLLHRDIQPHNIFFSEYGPVLGDFGIAALADKQDSRRIGFTTGYAAPEVLEGAIPTEQSDFYSLGATLYTALAGHRPFQRYRDESDEDLYRRIQIEQPADLSAQSIPEEVRRLIFGLMAKSPTDRPRRALDVGELFRSAQNQLGYPETPMVLPDADPGDLDLTLQTTVRGRNRFDDRAGGKSAQGIDSDGDDLTSATHARHLDDSLFLDPSARRPLSGTDRRMTLALGALVAVVSIASVGVWLAVQEPGAEDDDVGTLDFEATGPTTEVIEIESLVAPETVSVFDAGTALQLTWSIIDGAEAYRVEFLSEDRVAEVVDEPSLTLQVDEVSPPLCIQVRSVGDRGRLSPPSTRACGP